MPPRPSVSVVARTVPGARRDGVEQREVVARPRRLGELDVVDDHARARARAARRSRGRAASAGTATGGRARRTSTSSIATTATSSTGLLAAQLEAQRDGVLLRRVEDAGDVRGERDRDGDDAGGEDGEARRGAAASRRGAYRRWRARKRSPAATPDDAAGAADPHVDRALGDPGDACRRSGRSRSTACRGRWRRCRGRACGSGRRRSLPQRRRTRLAASPRPRRSVRSPRRGQAARPPPRRCRSVRPSPRGALADLEAGAPEARPAARRRPGAPWSARSCRARASTIVPTGSEAARRRASTNASPPGRRTRTRALLGGRDEAGAERRAVRRLAAPDRPGVVGAAAGVGRRGRRVGGGRRGERRRPCRRSRPPLAGGDEPHVVRRAGGQAGERPRDRDAVLAVVVVVRRRRGRRLRAERGRRAVLEPVRGRALAGSVSVRGDAGACRAPIALTVTAPATGALVVVVVGEARGGHEEEGEDGEGGEQPGGRLHIPVDRRGCADP